MGIKNPCFFGGFPRVFPKKQGKEGQGNGGGGDAGYATFVWQVRAHMHATQITQMHSLKPLIFCYVKNKAHGVIGASFACHREKTYPPLGPPIQSSRKIPPLNLRG